MSFGGASSDQAKDRRLSSLHIIGGNDCSVDNVRSAVDLRIQGGGLINKSLCVLGNINVEGMISGELMGNLLTTKIQEKELMQGIEIIGNLNMDSQSFFKGNVIIPSGGSICTSEIKEIVEGEGVLISSNANIDGTLTVGNNAQFDCNVNIDKDLFVAGNVNITSNIDVGGGANIFGDAVINNDMTINGNSTLCGSVLLKSTIDVQDTATFEDVIVNGDGNVAGNLSITSDLSVDGDGTIDGNLVVCGTTLLKGKITAQDTVTVDDLIVNGNILILGNTTEISTEMLTIEDNKVLINSIGATPGIDSGICINRYQTENDACIGDVVQDDPQETGLVAAAGASTVTLVPPVLRADDYYKDWFIKITSGGGINQVRKIVDFDGTTDIATIQTLWTVTPSASDGYELFGCKYVSLLWDESDNRWVFGCTANGNSIIIQTNDKMDLCVGDIDANNIIINEGVDMDCSNIANIQAIFVDQVFGKASPWNSEDDMNMRNGNAITFDEGLRIGNATTTATNSSDIAIGKGAESSGSISIAIGEGATAGFANTVVIGTGALATEIDDIRFGDPTSTSVGATARAWDQIFQNKVWNDTTTIVACIDGTGNFVKGGCGAAMSGNLDMMCYNVSNVQAMYVDQMFGKASPWNSEDDMNMRNGNAITFDEGLRIGNTTTTAATSVDIAIGKGAESSGSNSIAIGVEATTSSGSGVAIGQNSDVSSVGSIAIGQHSEASTGTFAIAIGGGSSSGAAADATAADAIAIGRSTTASAVDAIVIGQSASGSATQVVTIGQTADASSVGSIAIGQHSEASTGTFAIAIGGGSSSGAAADATAADAIAIGRSTTASAVDAIVIGQSASGSATQVVTIGQTADASSVGSIAIGQHSEASTGTFAIAIGGGASSGAAADATAADAIAIGRSTTASAVDAIVIGQSASGSATQVVTIGQTADASSVGSIAIGQHSEASTGTFAIAIGGGASSGAAADATAADAIAIGRGTTSDAASAVAIGLTADAGGVNSIATGMSATSSSANSVALGRSASATGTTGNNVALGPFSSATDTTNGSNLAVGTGAICNATDGFSVAIGSSSKTSATLAIAIGHYSYTMSASTAGIAMGRYATSIGSYAIAIGSGNVNAVATRTNAAGSNTISIGKHAQTGGSNCIAIGVGAGNAGTGVDNIALGRNALGAGPTTFSGEFNIGIGMSAGESITDGAHNVCIGNAAGDSITTGSNNVCIGYNTDVTAGLTGVVAIGNGITGGLAGGLFMSHRGPGAYTVNNAGFVAGTNELVEVTSSRRFKTNIQTLESVSDKFDRFRPVRYEAKPGHGDDREHIGLIAEEVEELFPELVTYEDEPDRKIPAGLVFDRITAINIKEIQSLRQRLARAETENIQLKTQIDNILTRLQNLEN